LQALATVEAEVQSCDRCGNLDTAPICAICQDDARTATAVRRWRRWRICGRLSASGGYRGLYHVLGGRLSALDGVRHGGFADGRTAGTGGGGRGA
jgi:recombination protein RecR